jgi:hypothetical protein
VQLFLGLVRPFEVLFLDEVTVSLDVVVRQDLLRWLRRETEVGFVCDTESYRSGGGLWSRSLARLSIYTAPGPWEIIHAAPSQ